MSHIDISNKLVECFVAEHIEQGLTDDQVARFLDLYEAGCSQQEIDNALALARNVEILHNDDMKLAVSKDGKVFVNVDLLNFQLSPRNIQLIQGESIIFKSASGSATASKVYLEISEPSTNSVVWETVLSSALATSEYIANVPGLYRFKSSVYSFIHGNITVLNMDGTSPASVVNLDTQSTSSCSHKLEPEELAEREETKIESNTIAAGSASKTGLERPICVPEVTSSAGVIEIDAEISFSALNRNANRQGARSPMVRPEDLPSTVASTPEESGTEQTSDHRSGTRSRLAVGTDAGSEEECEEGVYQPLRSDDDEGVLSQDEQRGKIMYLSNRTSAPGGREPASKESGCQADAPAERFFAALKEGNLSGMKHEMDLGLDINTERKEKETALHIAASQKQKDVLLFLLENGASFDTLHTDLLKPSNDAPAKEVAEIIARYERRARGYHLFRNSFRKDEGCDPVCLRCKRVFLAYYNSERCRVGHPPGKSKEKPKVVLKQELETFYTGLGARGIKGLQLAARSAPLYEALMEEYPFERTFLGSSSEMQSRIETRRLLCAFIGRQPDGTYDPSQPSQAPSWSSLSTALLAASENLAFTHLSKDGKSSQMPSLDSVDLKLPSNFDAALAQLIENVLIAEHYQEHYQLKAEQAARALSLLEADEQFARQEKEDKEIEKKKAKRKKKAAGKQAGQAVDENTRDQVDWGSDEDMPTTNPPTVPASAASAFNHLTKLAEPPSTRASESQSGSEQSSAGATGKTDLATAGSGSAADLSALDMMVGEGKVTGKGVKESKTGVKSKGRQSGAIPQSEGVSSVAEASNASSAAAVKPTGGQPRQSGSVPQTEEAPNVADASNASSVAAVKPTGGQPRQSGSIPQTEGVSSVASAGTASSAAAGKSAGGQTRQSGSIPQTEGVSSVASAGTASSAVAGKSASCQGKQSGSIPQTEGVSSVPAAGTASSAVVGKSAGGQGKQSGSIVHSERGLSVTDAGSAGSSAAGKSTAAPVRGTSSGGGAATAPSSGGATGLPSGGSGNSATSTSRQPTSAKPAPEAKVDYKAAISKASSQTSVIQQTRENSTGSGSKTGVSTRADGDEALAGASQGNARTTGRQSAGQVPADSRQPADPQGPFPVLSATAQKARSKVGQKGEKTAPGVANLGGFGQAGTDPSRNLVKAPADSGPTKIITAVPSKTAHPVLVPVSDSAVARGGAKSSQPGYRVPASGQVPEGHAMPMATAASGRSSGHASPLPAKLVAEHAPAPSSTPAESMRAEYMSHYGFAPTEASAQLLNAGSRGTGGRPSGSSTTAAPAAQSAKPGSAFQMPTATAYGMISSNPLPVPTGKGSQIKQGAMQQVPIQLQTVRSVPEAMEMKPSSPKFRHPRAMALDQGQNSLPLPDDGLRTPSSPHRGSLSNMWDSSLELPPGIDPHRLSASSISRSDGTPSSLPRPSAMASGAPPGVAQHHMFGSESPVGVSTAPASPSGPNSASKLQSQPSSDFTPLLSTMPAPGITPSGPLSPHQPARTQGPSTLIGQQPPLKPQETQSTVSKARAQNPQLQPKSQGPSNIGKGSTPQSHGPPTAAPHVTFDPALPPDEERVPESRPPAVNGGRGPPGIQELGAGSHLGQDEGKTKSQEAFRQLLSTAAARGPGVSAGGVEAESASAATAIEQTRSNENAQPQRSRPQFDPRSARSELLGRWQATGGAEGEAAPTSIKPAATASTSTPSSSQPQAEPPQAIAQPAHAAPASHEPAPSFSAAPADVVAAPAPTQYTRTNRDSYGQAGSSSFGNRRGHGHGGSDAPSWHVVREPAEKLPVERPSGRSYGPINVPEQPSKAVHDERGVKAIASAIDPSVVNVMKEMLTSGKAVDLIMANLMKADPASSSAPQGSGNRENKEFVQQCAEVVHKYLKQSGDKPKHQAFEQPRLVAEPVIPGHLPPGIGPVRGPITAPPLHPSVNIPMHQGYVSSMAVMSPVRGVMPSMGSLSPAQAPALMGPGLASPAAVRAAATGAQMAGVPMRLGPAMGQNPQELHYAAMGQMDPHFRGALPTMAHPANMMQSAANMMQGSLHGLPSTGVFLPMMHQMPAGMQAQRQQAWMQDPAAASVLAANQMTAAQAQAQAQAAQMLRPGMQVPNMLLAQPAARPWNNTSANKPRRNK